MNHFALKVRKGLNTDGLILVDSPGMIDSPKSNALPYDATMAERSTAERGYDFLRVTRWLAEHSDVILLFFDPDKPGTTGETLECLTSSLSGLEHKLHIVMNKVDQFVHIHDFARAYGSLLLEPIKGHPAEGPAAHPHDVPAAGGTQRQAALRVDRPNGGLVALARAR